MRKFLICLLILSVSMVTAFFLFNFEGKVVSANEGELVTATIFCIYNLKENQSTEEYDNYLIKTKIPGIRGAPWCTDFKTWKIDKVLGPAVSEPEGELPAESPYLYVAKIEVSDLDAMMSFLGTDAGKEFVKSWSVYMDPTAILTTGHEI